jgi:hypothetical protein
MIEMDSRGISTLVGLVAIAPIVRGRGTEGFGFLSLSWAMSSVKQGLGEEIAVMAERR